MDSLMSLAMPNTIAKAALEAGCKSVAYTYNDPVIFHEYAIDTALACREVGIKSVAVSAGYVCAEPRAEFYQVMDAANIDLKAFSESFYYKTTGSHLQPVLETLQYIKHETDVWLEITTLLIPSENDSEKELQAMVQWVMEKLGPDVPMHFSAFHPDWKMQTPPRTPLDTLLRARKIALENGVHYAYIGNAHDKAADSTYCHHCGDILIGRDWYELSEWNLENLGACLSCKTKCAGLFDSQPGQWGAKRQVVKI
jgi:pyruvate formate lyase activating enzyme